MSPETLIKKDAVAKVKKDTGRPDIVFYQQYPTPYFGLLLLIARLKAKGFNVDVIIDDLEQDGLKKLRSLNPKLIGISCLSVEHRWVIEQSRRMKEVMPDIPIIVGGIHAQLYPKEIARDASHVDLVCNSEGESVIFDVLAEYEHDEQDWTSIDGLTYWKDGEIVSNEVAELVDYDPDILEDRTIYYNRYPQLAGDHVHQFFSARGCPYKCSFCYNPNLQDIFKGKGSFIRHKSVDTFIQELKNVKNKYDIKTIFFYDDFFTYNVKWLQPFLIKYKKEIGLPFYCTTIADLMPESTAKMLAEAGCRTVSFGIETGSYRIRKEILDKDITDDEMISCALYLKKYGIKIQTTNMFALPDETLEDAFSTIELNHKCKTDYAFSALFLAFPNQGITNYAIKQGQLKKGYSLHDMPHSFLATTLVDIPDVEAIKNIHRMTYWFVAYPWIYKIFKHTVTWKIMTPFFFGMSLLGNFIRHKEERGITFVPSLKYAWRMRKSF